MQYEGHMTLNLLSYSNYFRKEKNTFPFSIISQHWYGAGSWNPFSWKTRSQLSCTFNSMVADDVSRQGTRVLSYYSDLPLLQAFQPMSAQLSKKAVLLLAKILATASCRSIKTGPRVSTAMVFTQLSWNIPVSVAEGSIRDVTSIPNIP